MLKITSDGKKLALDPRCFVPESQDEEGSKLNECADRIYEVWTDTAGIKGTQIVFCDLSTPKVKFEDYEYGKDFDAYNDLKYKLVQRGIPDREIVYIHEANTDEQKQALFDRVNSGAVRVLIGSTEKCGAGTNVQKRLVALHHLDTPYRPSDMEQREGRIIRQGNTNDKVKIFTYVTERTFDSYSYQILENKQRFISQINRGDLTIREAEDIDETTLSYAEIKAITAANPKIKRKMEVDAEVARLRVLEGQYKKNLYELQDKIYKNYPEDIRKQELYIERVVKDLEMLKSKRPADAEDFSISVNGKVYTDKKEGGKALLDALYSGKVNIPVAEYCGFKISMNPMSMIANEREITLAAEGQYVISIGDSAFGTLTRLENFLNDLPDREARLKKRLAQLNADLEIAKEQVEKPFEQAEQLKTLLSEQAELNAELNLDKRDDVIVADENDSGDEDNNYRALPDIRKRNMEVNIIDEEDKVAAMQVDLLPDYAVTNEDMHAYGYTWDGMLPITGAAAKTISKLGVTVYELTPTDNEYEVKATELFDEKDKVFGVEKPDWNAFIQSDKGRDYIAARREVVKSVLTSLDGEDMRYFTNTELEYLWEQYGTEVPALDKALGERGIPSNTILKRYAVPVFDEQVEKLKAGLPFEEHGWSEADIHYAVFGNVEVEELKDVLFRHSYEKRLNAFLDKELAEYHLSGGRITGFTEDEIIDLSTDLKAAFEDSEFAGNMTGEDYDYWYDDFQYDEVIPMLNKRALPGEKYMPQYEDNPLGLPPLDDELTVLDVQQDIELDEKRTIKGAALLKNEVVNGWYVLGFTHDGDGEALSVGDKTNIEKLGVSPVEIDPNTIRTFDSEQEARDFYDERVKVLNSLKENYDEFKLPDYEEEVCKSVNTEYEVFKSDILSRRPEEIYRNNYKIRVFTELKELILLGAESGYLQPEHYKALYRDRGSILNELYSEFVNDENASVNDYSDTAQIVRNYCEDVHSDIFNGKDKQPVYLKTAQYALEHGEFKQYQASRRLTGDEVELTAEEFAGLVNHTSDKDYEREEKPRVSVNIPRDALIKAYDNSSLYRAPNGTKYAEYAYYLPNSVVRENTQAEDSSMTANIAEDFTVTLRKDKEEIKISAQEFKELVGNTNDEDYKREPTAMDEYCEQQKDDGKAWSEIALSEKAVIAAYEKSTLIRMPKGKYEGMVYYIPSGMVRKDENGLRLHLPEDFEVHLKGGSDEKTDLTAQQLMEELAGKRDEDYESIYRRPSEEARKKFDEIETNLRSSLPDEMRNKSNWVVVRTRENNDTGRLEKFLIDVHTGKFAESDNPKTWTDFDSACEYAKEHGGVALAYALDGKDGIACIDLDKCIGEDGKRTPLAEEVLSKCGKTYIEHSLSGKGLHIFGRTKGADLRSFSKDGDMEYYQGGQFIAMTGDGTGFYQLGDFDTPEMKSLLERKLERRTEWTNVGKGEAGLAQMDDRELLEKAFSAKNGDTVRRLYNGEDLRHNHSNSDMSLMNYLAFYSGGNVEQMTRIFATSGLYRPEKDASYYEHTAIKAAKDTPHYTPPKAPAQPPKSASSGNAK